MMNKKRNKKDVHINPDEVLRAMLTNPPTQKEINKTLSLPTTQPHFYL